MTFIAHKKLFVLTTLTVVLLITAQPLMAETRFTLNEIDNGYIMLNQETGVISVCTKTDTELFCKARSRELTQSDTKELSSKNTVSKEQSDSPKRPTKTLYYYFKEYYSEELQAKSSAFYGELTKRLYKMVDEIKALNKAPNA